MPIVPEWVNRLAEIENVILISCMVVLSYSFVGMTLLMIFKPSALEKILTKVKELIVKARTIKYEREKRK